MKRTNRAVLMAISLARFCTAATIFSLAAMAVAGDADTPRVFQCSGAALAAARQRALAGDSAMAPILKALRERGDSLLGDGPFTIVNKLHPLPGVDPHDYVSIAPYYWPNPATPTELPYIHRDGVRNQETREYDARHFSDLSEHVWGLALAGYMTGDERYSRRAALLLRAWFFDPATRMNPNLDHAQLVKGENVGRGTGVIESNRFLNVLDGVGLLKKAAEGHETRGRGHGTSEAVAASGSTGPARGEAASPPSPSTGEGRGEGPNRPWSADDQARLEDWFRAYLKWLRESPNGQAESRATNNHGTWYDVQETTFMLFVGDEAGARQVLEVAKTKRIAAQIQPDGQMPRELTRTKSWGYSCFNLKALTLLADLGQRVDVDLWNYRAPDGRSIRAALDFLLPFATGQHAWPHQQISRFDSKELLLPLRRAAIALKDRKYIDALAQLRAKSDIEGVNSLGFPLPQLGQQP